MTAPKPRDLTDLSVDRAVDLAASIRDRDPAHVARITDPLDRHELVALVVALAAMCPADVDPLEALAWVNLPVDKWPDRVVFGEAGRHDNGATDTTALQASREAARRRRAVLRSVTTVTMGVRRARAVRTTGGAA